MCISRRSGYSIVSIALLVRGIIKKNKLELTSPPPKVLFQAGFDDKNPVMHTRWLIFVPPVTTQLFNREFVRKFDGDLSLYLKDRSYIQSWKGIHCELINHKAKAKAIIYALEQCKNLRHFVDALEMMPRRMGEVIRQRPRKKYREQRTNPLLRDRSFGLYRDENGNAVSAAEWGKLRTKRQSE